MEKLESYTSKEAAWRSRLQHGQGRGGANGAFHQHRNGSVPGLSARVRSASLARCSGQVPALVVATDGRAAAYLFIEGHW
jgi:hypothetical protein